MSRGGRARARAAGTGSGGGRSRVWQHSERRRRRGRAGGPGGRPRWARRKSAIGTLVERTTRCTMRVPLPADHAAPAVAEACPGDRGPARCAAPVADLGSGREMRAHAQIAVDADVEIYFCDSKQRQRGSNENNNGLLRQYSTRARPGGYTTGQLAAVADELNGRPARPWAGRARPRRWRRSGTRRRRQAPPITGAADAALLPGGPRAYGAAPPASGSRSPAASACGRADPETSTAPGRRERAWHSLPPAGTRHPDRNRMYIVGVESVIYRRCCNDPLSSRQSQLPGSP